MTEKHQKFNTWFCGNCCCGFQVLRSYANDYVTHPWYGNATTISGGIKWFGWGSENRLKLTLNCDEHTLEFHLLNEDQGFWKVKLSEQNRNLKHFPVVVLYYKTHQPDFVIHDDRNWSN